MENAFYQSLCTFVHVLLALLSIVTFIHVLHLHFLRCWLKGCAKCSTLFKRVRMFLNCPIRLFFPFVNLACPSRKRACLSGWLSLLESIMMRQQLRFMLRNVLLTLTGAKQTSGKIRTGIAFCDKEDSMEKMFVSTAFTTPVRKSSRGTWHSRRWVRWTGSWSMEAYSGCRSGPKPSSWSLIPWLSGTS